MPFENITGLYALLTLIPFIILYLRRPELKEQTIPSLMFLMKEEKITSKYSFLRKLIQNLLFIMQLAAIILLSLAIAAPYITIPYNVAADHTVIVLDASASMQTKDGSKTRFEKAIDEAKKISSSRISLILAENTPFVYMEDGTTASLHSILNTLKPKATTTNIGDAILLANDLLKGEEGRIVVISDFIATEGADILVTKRQLAAKGNKVEFIDVSNKADNVGIIDLDISKQETRVFIKNYNENEKSIKIKLTGNNKELAKETISIAANSIESLVFETPTGVSQIELEPKDDLNVDNINYISAPSTKKIKILLITNDEKSSLRYALEASKDFELDIRKPPATNAEKTDADVIIVSDIEKARLLPHEFDFIARHIEKGIHLVIAAQSDLNDIDTADLLPITIDGVGDSTTICIDVFNQFTKQFENERCFARSSSYLKSAAENSSLAIASADDNTPIFVTKKKGNGIIFYYGIIDKESNFNTLPSYPIFWSQLIGFLTQSKNIDDFNYKTGSIIAINEQEVQTPSGKIKTSKLVLDEAGIYEFSNKKVAVNLVNEKESDINAENKKIKESQASFEAKKEKTKRELYLEMSFIIIALILMCAEIVYIKFRGDV